MIMDATSSLAKLGVRTMPGHKLLEIRENSILLEDNAGYRMRFTKHSGLPYCCKAKISKPPPLPAGTFFQLLIGIEYRIQDMLSLISIKNKKMYLTAD